VDYSDFHAVDPCRDRSGGLVATARLTHGMSPKYRHNIYPLERAQPSSDVLDNTEGFRRNAVQI
jgi:hypothetical protein